MWHVALHRRLDELAPISAAWRELAGGVPFREWDWFRAWWQTFGENATHRMPRRQLFTYVVYDDSGTVAAIAPFYLEQRHDLSRTLRIVGSDAVCGEYLGILSQPGLERQIAETLANHISRDHPSLFDWLSGDPRQRWHFLEMAPVADEDSAVEPFVAQMAALGHEVDRRAADSCWRLQLPETWDELLSGCAKSHRKALRRAARRLDEPHTYTVHHAETQPQLDQGLQILADLHAARWQGRGQSGCFAQPGLMEFHRAATAGLLAADRLHLYWITKNARPIAAEYHLVGDDTLYVYQGGLDPAHLDEEPGHLATLAGARWALDRGLRAIDFLRGDEAYKARWGARPQSCRQWRVVAPIPSARMRHRAWRAQRQVKAWLKSRWSNLRRAAGDVALPGSWRGTSWRPNGSFASPLAPRRETTVSQ